MNEYNESRGGNTPDAPGQNRIPSGRDRSAFPLRRFLAVMIVTLAVLIFSEINVWTHHEKIEADTARALELQTLSRKVVYLDEVLTMSARMAASTGQTQWEDRYRGFEPKLDAAIVKLVKMIPQAYESRDTTAVDAANKRLVEMENKSFELVRQGQPAKGAELLDSSEYKDNKEIYTADMERVDALIAKTINATEKRFDRANRVAAILTAAAVLTLMVAWPAVLLQMRKHISQRKETEHALRELVQKIKAQDWLKTGQTELSDTMRGEQSTADLARNIVSQMATYLNAQIGAVYLTENDGELRMAGSYAYTRRKDVSSKFKFGQGLVGQAALESRSIVVTDVPEDYVPIQSGVGRAVAKNILVQPLVYEDRVTGVIELGSFQEFSSTDLEFIEKVAENIAITINSAQARRQMSELLEETQRQSEELQNQQEELRAANAELERQTESLKRSEETLKVQQEELEGSNSDLEEKTAALEEQKHELEKSWQEIKAKSQELESANKCKSEFLSNMSHELRTPLNSLLILAKMLTENTEGNLTDEQLESAQVIYEGGTELLSLINEILDLSKVEAGKMEINSENLNIQKLLESLEKDFTHTAHKKGLEFKTHLAEDLDDCISSDGKRVRQILKNLLSNAFKFTEKGSVNIDIYRAAAGTSFTRSSLNHGEVVAFAVSDTGVGISKEKQRMIFGAFQQADGTIDRRYGGTGLGLSISQELAKLLGGEIRLQSEQGEGSTFTLYLPVRTRESGRTESPSAFEAVENGDSDVYTTGRERITTSGESTGAKIVSDDRDIIGEDDKSILIVEDDAKFARILMDMSHDKGFKCMVAGDGETGLKFAAEKKPNAVILDIGLPGIDGFSVIDALKDNPMTRHIPVHFISGQDEVRSETKALSMGAIGYLTKPVAKEQLDETFDTIEEFISRDIKKLLIAEDDANTRESIVKLVGSDDIEIAAVGTGQQAYDLLKSQKFDCMVLDLGLPDMSGFDLLSRMRDDEEISDKPPVVIYSGRELSREEATELKEYAGSVILKGAESPERLLDETSLFLHRVESSLPREQRRLIQMVHDRDSILEGRKVLVVDDDVRNVFALSHALKAQRMTVIRAENGQQALELLEANPSVDVVLMDIMMPVMDGYEAMRRIREQKRYWKLPILALTAKAMKGDREKCIEAGANDYLAKPIDIEKVLSMLRVWLYM